MKGGTGPSVHLLFHGYSPVQSLLGADQPLIEANALLLFPLFPFNLLSLCPDNYFETLGRPLDHDTVTATFVKI